MVGSVSAAEPPINVQCGHEQVPDRCMLLFRMSSFFPLNSSIRDPPQRLFDYKLLSTVVSSYKARQIHLKLLWYCRRIPWLSVDSGKSTIVATQHASQTLTVLQRYQSTMVTLLFEHLQASSNIDTNQVGDNIAVLP